MNHNCNNSSSNNDDDDNDDKGVPALIGCSTNHSNNLHFIISLETNEIATRAAEQTSMLLFVLRT